MIQFFRIDDRLIHGQIATTWTRHINPSLIVVANDKTANNPMLASLQRMSAPRDFDLSVLTVEDAINKLNGEYKNEKVFLLVNSVKDAYHISINCDVANLNVGNIGYKEGHFNLINRIFVSAEDISDLRKLNDRGIKVYAQMLPSESVDIITNAVIDKAK